MSEKDKEEGAEGEEEVQYKNLSQDMKDEIDEVWDIFDRQHEGSIGFLDFGTMLRWLKFYPTEKELKAYMEKYDKKKENRIDKNAIFAIVDQKVLEPISIEQLIESMKLLDSSNDGTIPVPELRWAMTKLGDCLDESQVDDMIKELDSDSKGYVEILEFAKVCFNIKEKKKKD